MKTNVDLEFINKVQIELEFINKVQELNKKMRDLANFWHDNSETLEDLNVSKDYPFSKSFDELTFDSHNWLLTLAIAKFCKK